MKRLGILLGYALVASAVMQMVDAQAGSGALLERDWRITRVVRAPWVADDRPVSTQASWVGRTISFDQDSVDGPGLLHCGHAALESTSFPAEGLFQGTLPSPATSAAQELGIAHLPVSGVSLTCDTGLFEFHRVDAETLLLGLDNQVLTLSRTPGTMALADTPEGRVQRFLEDHFSGDMGFAQSTGKAHRAWFSKRLNQALNGYFAKPPVEDEVPAVDGDPFTDSQEYPQRFAVGKAQVSDGKSELTVRFSDAFSDRNVVYVLQREEGVWQLEDLRFESKESLLGLLEY